MQRFIGLVLLGVSVGACSHLGSAAPSVRAQRFDTRDAFAVMKRLEPQLMASCGDRSCASGGQGLVAGTEKASFVARNPSAFGTADNSPSLDFAFTGCQADMTGCAALVMSASYRSAGIKPATAERWNKEVFSPCRAFERGGVAGVEVRLRLEEQTGFDEIEDARTALAGCRAEFEAFALKNAGKK